MSEANSDYVTFRTEMSAEYIERLMKLNQALGLALGALEVVRLCPYDFNQDGVKYVIDKIKELIEEQGGGGE